MIARELAVPKLSSTAHEARVSGEGEEMNASKSQDTLLTRLIHQTLGGVFDEAFDLYKRRFGLLALIVALIYIPSQILMYAMGNLWLKPAYAQSNATDTDYIAIMTTVLLGFLIGSPQEGVPGFLPLMFSFMASGPVSKAVGSIVMGRKTSVRDAYRGSFPVLMRLGWAWTLFAFVIIASGAVSWIVIFLVFSLIVIALSAAGLTAATEAISVLVAILLFLVPYLFATALGAVFFAFFAPAVAIEKLTIAGAVGRTVQLVRKGLFLRVWAAVTLLPIVIYGLQILILLSASSFTAALHLPALGEFLLVTAFANGVCFFLQPYWMVFIALLYYDFRIRREGLDIRAILEGETIDSGQRERG